MDMRQLTVFMQRNMTPLLVVSMILFAWYVQLLHFTACCQKAQLFACRVGEAAQEFAV
jgi:hypothetical protein